MRSILQASVFLGLLAVSACTLTEDPELEGISFSASDAIAHNNALQRIDPWPAGVQDTDLVVPAERGSRKPPAAEAEAGGSDYDAAASVE